MAAATSAAEAGGINALVTAAGRAARTSSPALPANWADYGTMMADFAKEPGIKINDAKPDGSSQDEMNAMTQLKASAGPRTCWTWARRSR